MLETELQKEVIEKAREYLNKKKFEWFKGRICLDLLPDDIDIRKKGIDEVASSIAMDTIYWDGTTMDIFK